jgi:hypothetical protein
VLVLHNFIVSFVMVRQPMFHAYLCEAAVCEKLKVVAFSILFRSTMPPRVAPVQVRASNGDVDSIYYVHPSEGSNSWNITPQLNGSNYLSWPR